MKTPRTWYVVLNGHEARILHDLDHPHDPKHITDLAGPNRTRRDTLNDRPARSFASGSGGARSAVEPASDPLHEDRRKFLRDVFDYLEKRLDHDYERLFLIGAPDIVGQWRDAVPDALKARTDHEVIRNLVNLPAPELVAAVKDLVSA